MCPRQFCISAHIALHSAVPGRLSSFVEQRLLVWVVEPQGPRDSHPPAMANLMAALRIWSHQRRRCEKLGLVAAVIGGRRVSVRLLRQFAEQLLLNCCRGTGRWTERRRGAAADGRSAPSIIDLQTRSVPGLELRRKWGYARTANGDAYWYAQMPRSENLSFARSQGRRHGPPVSSIAPRA